MILNGMKFTRVTVITNRTAHGQVSNIVVTVSLNTQIMFLSFQ